MNGRRGELPPFIADLGGEQSDVAFDVAGELHRLVAPGDATAQLGARLAREIEELPLRYAPFYERIAAVWDLSVPEVVGVLERARQPEAWHKTALPGLRLCDVQGGPRTSGADVHLVRFSPGMRFPKHRHPGDEALFVLEGSYQDSCGRRVGPGDLQEMPAGSEHGFVVARGGPCVAASVQRGREFTGWLIRFLSKFV
jgi:anti-sigma factor ChrR (cupin superfamily)